MAWPTDDDYRAMVQHPQRAFRAPELQACTVETYRDGRPKGRSGNFALVYRLINGSSSCAVRFFKQPPRSDQAERFLMMSRHLQKTRPLGLVDFSYDPEGFRFRQEGFPVLTLRWVEGETLGLWLKGAVLRKDAAAIGRMADAWVELVTDLRSHNIAHGDLQHGNVMVENEKLVLVDYDCMFVPEMVTEEQRTPTEFGMPGYQHPDRPHQLLSAELDNFSAWVILIALRAIADDLSIWHRYVEARDTENIMFTLSDIEHPDQSPIWDELITRSSNLEVRKWTQALLDSIGEPFEKILRFDFNVWEEFEVLVARGDWREIHTLATSAKYASRTFPPHLAPKVDEAIRRVESLSGLSTKGRANRARDIASAYRPDLLDDWPEAASAVIRAKAAKVAVAMLDDLDRAEKADSTGQRLVTLWNQRGQELQGFAEADDASRKVETWSKRIEAASRLEQAVKRGTPERAIADAWEAVTALGGHPNADPHRSRATLATRRVAVLAQLNGLPTTPDEASDSALMKAWDGAATLLDGCLEAEPLRDRAAAASKRAALLTALLQQIAEADSGRGPEKAVVEAADALPPGYGTAQATRVSKARGRIASTEALDKTLRATPQSDLAIAGAADRARADGSMTTEPAVVARCALAARRRDLLKTLDAISEKLPLDKQDAQWLAAWDASLLDPCHDARGHRARHELAATRTATFAALERALTDADAVEVRRLARNKILADHPGLARRRSEIDQLLAASEKVERLLQAVKQGSADAFFTEVEPTLLATNAATFLPHREQIEAWIDARLTRGDVLRSSNPAFLPVSTGPAVTARWAWGQQRLVRTCLVATDTTRFLGSPDEARRGLQRLDLDTYRRTKGGVTVSLPPGCRRLYVTVWPVVDLGWSRRTGPSHQIGPYVAAAAKASRSVIDRRRPLTRIRDWLLDFLNR